VAIPVLYYFRFRNAFGYPGKPGPMILEEDADEYWRQMKVLEWLILACLVLFILIPFCLAYMVWAERVRIRKGSKDREREALEQGHRESEDFQVDDKFLGP